MLSRCWRKVLRDRDRASISRRNGVKHSTIRSPHGMSRFSYAQLLGHLIEVRAVALQGIGGGLLRWQAGRSPGNVLGFCHVPG